MECLFWLKYFILYMLQRGLIWDIFTCLNHPKLIFSIWNQPKRKFNILWNGFQRILISENINSLKTKIKTAMIWKATITWFLWAGWLSIIFMLFTYTPCHRWNHLLLSYLNLAMIIMHKQSLDPFFRVNETKEKP